MRGNNRTVSVIVPVYNVAEYLERCISSIINQTYRLLQIILVDDGSIDGSAGICDKYAELDDRVVVLHKQNEGLVRARKSGLAAATGEYVCYVDGDDWIETDMIRCLVRDMAALNVDLTVSGYYLDMKGYMQSVPCQLKTGVYEAKDIIPRMLYAGQFYEFGVSQFIWAKLFRKSILWDIQMSVDNEINCGEDVAVTYPYLLKCGRIYSSDLTAYHYVQRAGSIMNRHDADERAHNMHLIRYLHKVFRQSEYWQCLERQLNQYTKNLFLTRDIAWFDTPDDGRCLKPYGGIPSDALILIYGAGKMGQTLYRYLGEKAAMNIVGWFDRNYLMYQAMGLNVNHPDHIKKYGEGIYDFVILAINNQNIIGAIYNYLEDMGINRQKIRWLCEDFVKESNDITRYLV